MACTRLNEVCAFPVRPNTGYEECQQLASELRRWVTDHLRDKTAPPRPDTFSDELESILNGMRANFARLPR